MNVARQREHRLSAALYDPMTASLEHAVLGPRRASLLGDLCGEVLESARARARTSRISVAPAA